MTGWVAALCAALAASLVVPLRARLPRPVEVTPPPPASGWMLRFRLLWCAAAGLGGAVFVGGRAGPLMGLGAAVAAWVVITRAEPPQARRAREAVRRDLPLVVDLFAAALRAGASPGDGVAVVCVCTPGR